ncbi:MAG: hypothetical protein HRF49_07965 [bacterium]
MRCQSQDFGQILLAHAKGLTPLLYTFAYPQTKASIAPGKDFSPNFKNPLTSGGATIFGCALQLAFHKGCRAVVCVGIDMKGNGYYDGSANLYRPGGPWMHVPIVDAMIRTMQAKRPDFRVYSLSPTALDIPIMEVV